MVSTLSESPIDLSLVGVDVAPDNPDPASLRSYRVVLGLRSGVTWGSARTFEGDLELAVAPGPR
jgi:hypothetical protein